MFCQMFDISLSFKIQVEYWESSYVNKKLESKDVASSSRPLDAKSLLNLSVIFMIYFHDSEDGYSDI